MWLWPASTAALKASYAQSTPTATVHPSSRYLDGKEKEGGRNGREKPIHDAQDAHEVPRGVLPIIVGQQVRRSLDMEGVSGGN